MSEKVCEGVWLVGGSELTDPGDCLVYLVDLERESVLIDTGTGSATDKLLENIKETGIEPSTISTLILTHCHVDHIGGANEIREATGARVVAHEGDAQAIEIADPDFTVERYYGIKLGPIPVDVKLSGAGEKFDFAQERLSWLHTPGHTPGSIAVVFESERGQTVLFGQDIHGPFEPGFKSDIGQWRESMQKLLALEPDVLCEGHFGIYRPAQAARAFIEQYLRQYS